MRELAGWGAADQFIIDNSADVESSITVGGQEGYC